MYGVTTPNGYTIGSRTLGERAFTGVLRQGRTVVLECGHQHTNRNWTTKSGGESATDCLSMILAGAQNQATAETRALRYRTAWQRLESGFFVVPTGTIAAAKVDGERNARSYLAAVDAARALIAAAKPQPPKPAEAPAEAEVGDIPAWMC